MRDAILDSFRKRWTHIHTMTIEFAKGVPEAHWMSSPHPGFAPFAKQLRHVVCVRGVYNDGLSQRRADFARKHAFFKGEPTRPALLDGLERTHVELLGLLDEAPVALDQPCIDFFGNSFSWLDYLHGYVQHESIHHGQWSLYAAHAGHPTPPMWRLQWGLDAGRV